MGSWTSPGLQIPPLQQAALIFTFNLAPQISLITSKGCSPSSLSDLLLLLKFFVFTSGQNTASAAASFLLHYYFPVPFFSFSSYFLTLGPLKVYSSIHCSCLLMVCFLETSSRIPVSMIISVWRTPKSPNHSNYISGLCSDPHFPSRSAGECQ